MNKKLGKGKRIYLGVEKRRVGRVHTICIFVCVVVGGVHKEKCLFSLGETGYMFVIAETIWVSTSADI